LLQNPLTQETLPDTSQFSLASLSLASSSGYDDHSRLRTVADPVNNTTTYSYTAADHVATETDPRGKVTTYVYDGVGNLTQKTDRDERVIQYGFDADNRPTTETWVRASYAHSTPADPLTNREE
jgi:YD repeat-containing protein